MSLLDKLPLFGTMRRARGWMRRNRLWIYLGLVVVLIYIVRPVLIMLAGIFDILKGPIRALLDNPVGSFIFYNLLGILLLWIVWRRVRSWVYRMFGLRAMRAFLDGMNAMILSNWGAAIPHFQKVYRIARWIRLEDAVPEHRDIAADTSLKIAACNLRLGNANEAKSWLLRVRDKDILTDHVRRNHAELRALAYDINDELEAETVLKELAKTESRDRGNRRVLRALRDRLEAGGDLDRTRTVARKLVAATEGPDKEEAQSHLALLEFRLAHKAVGEGKQREVRRALKARAGDVRAALLLGDQAL
ncbi:MAG: tetratricopeptide repeat protein, partial [Planctomycetota bacterium]